MLGEFVSLLWIPKAYFFSGRTDSNLSIFVSNRINFEKYQVKVGTSLQRSMTPRAETITVCILPGAQLRHYHREPIRDYDQIPRVGTLGSAPLGLASS